MSTKTFDPKNVSLTINGIPISGFADGTFISIVQDEDLFNATTGADGEVARIKNNNRMATLTINLLSTSGSNDVLSGLYNADVVANEGVFPLVVKDNNGATTHFSSAAWISKLPDVNYSTEEESKSWELKLASVDGFVGGVS